MAEREFEHDGCRLAYEVHGTGPFVGFAHGLMSSRAIVRQGGFDPRALATGRRLMQYDARGHGRSSGRAIAADYHWSNLGRDLLCLVNAIAGTEPVDFVGSSMGTGSLLWAALRAPHRFRRLVLTSPSTAWNTRPPQAMLYRRQAEAIERIGTAAWLATQPPAPDGATVPPPDIAEELLPSVLRGAAESDLPPAEELASLPHRTLIVAAADDPAHPVSTARALHDLLPEAILHVSTSVVEEITWERRIADFLAA